MNKRVALRGTFLTLLLIFVYVFGVFPADALFNPYSLAPNLAPQIIRQSTANQAALQVGVPNIGRLYGMLGAKNQAEKSAYIGGFPIAMALYTDGVIIEEISTVDTALGKATPAASLQRGDFLVEIDGEKITKSGDIERVLNGLRASDNKNDNKTDNKIKESNDKKDIDLSADTILKDANGQSGSSGKSTNSNGRIIDNSNSRASSSNVKVTGDSNSRASGSNFKITDSSNGKASSSSGKINGANNCFRKSLDELPTGTDVNDGKVLVTILRGGDKKSLEITPATEVFSCKRRLGLVVRDYILGIGTVSFVKEDGCFGALGHPVTDSVAGRVPIKGGHVFRCEEISIVKGEKGRPGEFRVRINSVNNPLGEIYRNADNGIYGKFNSLESVQKCHAAENRKPFPIAKRKKVNAGKAMICTTIAGKTDFYKIEIIKAANQSSVSDKGLIVRVTDKRLLDKTGGIIQGMSGSPIIQNGMLVGSVTHVFINDPTKGYGIYMDFMCD